MKINVHVERLILDGVSVPHRELPLLQAAFEIELSRLIATDGLSPSLLSGGAIYSVPSEAVQLTSENNPSELGQQIAQSVYGGIGR